MVWPSIAPSGIETRTVGKAASILFAPSIAPSGIETKLVRNIEVRVVDLQSHLRVLKLAKKQLNWVQRGLQSHLRVLKPKILMGWGVKFSPSIAPSGIETFFYVCV